MTGNAVIAIDAAMNSANGQNADARRRETRVQRGAIASPSAIGSSNAEHADPSGRDECVRARRRARATPRRR